MESLPVDMYRRRPISGAKGFRRSPSFRSVGDGFACEKEQSGLFWVRASLSVTAYSPHLSRRRRPAGPFLSFHLVTDTNAADARSDAVRAGTYANSAAPADAYADAARIVTAGSGASAADVGANTARVPGGGTITDPHAYAARVIRCGARSHADVDAIAIVGRGIRSDSCIDAAGVCGPGARADPGVYAARVPFPATRGAYADPTCSGRARGARLRGGRCGFARRTRPAT
jgi:hypothetical protein